MGWEARLWGSPAQGHTVQPPGNPSGCFGEMCLQGDLGVQLEFGMGWKSCQHYEICGRAAVGWIEGWIPTTQKVAGHNLPLPRPSWNSLGWASTFPLSRAGERLFHPAQHRVRRSSCGCQKKKSSPTGFLFPALCEGWVQPSSRFPVLWVTGQSQQLVTGVMQMLMGSWGCVCLCPMKPLWKLCGAALER